MLGRLLVLAKVVTLEEFRDKNDLSSTRRRLSHETFCGGDIRRDVARHRHLNRGDGECVLGHERQLTPSAVVIASITSGESGCVLGWNLATMEPSLPITNFSKFQRMSPE